RRGAGALVVGQLADPAHVPLVGVRLGGQERLHDGGRLLDAVHAGAEADDLSVVVLAGQTGGLDAPRQARANALDLVGRDLLAVARATDYDAQAAPGSGAPPGVTGAVRSSVGRL